MKLLDRLQRLAFDVPSLQSTDLRLWSDRKRVLLFFLTKLCGDDETLAEGSMQVCLQEHSTDDEITATAKSFQRLFAWLGLESVTIENILGTEEDSNEFLALTLDIIESMAPIGTHEMDESGKRSGLEGFMSNMALVDAACSRLKDLIKVDMDLFPANLKQEAVPFREDVDQHVECCFGEVLGLVDSLREQLRNAERSPEETTEILHAIHPSVIDRGAYDSALLQLRSTFEKANQQVQEFVKTFPTCVKTEPAPLQGIGLHAQAMAQNYQHLIHLMDLLKSIRATKNAITEHTNMHEMAELKRVVHRMEGHTGIISKSRSHPF